jgi:hypothetical protein
MDKVAFVIRNWRFFAQVKSLGKRLKTLGLSAEIVCRLLADPRNFLQLHSRRFLLPHNPAIALAGTRVMNRMLGEGGGAGLAARRCAAG